MDKTSIAEGLNVGLVDWSLTSEYFGQTVQWSVIDPDDPATDQDNVDPNGIEGDDNGYLGSAEEYLPAILPTFHESQEDAINSINPVTSSTVDDNCETKIWMRVYPDESEYEGYHAGDNYLVSASVLTTTEESDTVTAWKKMRIEYDYMVDDALPDICWWVLNRIYSGYNLDDPGIREYNWTPYVEFTRDNIHLLESESDLPHHAFTSPDDMRDYWNSHRSKDDTLQYPFYLVGADSALFDPTLIGATLFLDDPTYIFLPRISAVFVPKIRRIHEDKDPDSVDLYIGALAAHELGHFAAKLVDYEDDPNEHTSFDCLMCLIQGFHGVLENPRFCNICIYRFRGNMYIEGPQVY